MSAGHISTEGALHNSDFAGVPVFFLLAAVLGLSAWLVLSAWQPAKMLTLHALGASPSDSPFTVKDDAVLAELQRSSVDLPDGAGNLAELPIPANRFKALCRRGVPDKFRVSMWLKSIADLSDDAAELAEAGTPEHIRRLDARWDALLARVARGDSFSIASEQDLAIPESVLRPLTDMGRAAALRVLTVFERTHTVGFSPILGRLVPRLLIYCSEGVAYHIVDSMWTRRPFFFPKTRNEWAAMLTCFDQLVGRFFSQTHDFMEGVDAFHDPNARRIILHVFEDLIPLHSVLRFLDAYILEGQKIIFRVLLGLIKLCKRELKDSGINTSAGVWAFLENYAHNRCDADALMESAFAARYRRVGGGLKRAHVEAAMTRRLQEFEIGEGAAHEIVEEVTKVSVGKTEAPQDQKQEPSERARGPLRSVSSGEIQVEHPLTEEHRYQLANWVPASFRSLAVALLYDSRRDGSSLSTLYRLNDPKSLVQNARDVGLQRLMPARVLVVCEAGTDHMAGVFTTEPWRFHPRGYGTGQNFVFRLHPDPKAFYWNQDENEATATQSAQNHAVKHMLATHEYIAAGGNNEGVGVALQVDADLREGFSTRCDTYQNECLFSKENFIVGRVLVFGMGIERRLK